MPKNVIRPLDKVVIYVLQILPINLIWLTHFGKDFKYIILSKSIHPKQSYYTWKDAIMLTGILHIAVEHPYEVCRLS